MAARGTIAKETVVKKLREAFGEDYIGEYEKKYYVLAEEAGSMVQIAISLTCPKSEINPANTVKTADLDFENPTGPIIAAEPERKNVEYTEEERKTVNDLIRKLGL